MSVPTAIITGALSGVGLNATEALAAGWLRTIVARQANDESRAVCLWELSEALTVSA